MLVFMGDPRLRTGMAGLGVLVFVGLAVAAGRWVTAGLAPPVLDLTTEPEGVHEGTGGGGGSAGGRDAAAGDTPPGTAPGSPADGQEAGRDGGQVVTEASLAVHVCGCVKQPGVYRLRPAERPRVADAVQAAGGFSANADTEALNLARAVADGEQVYIPAVAPVSPGGGVRNGRRGASGAGQAKPGGAGGVTAGQRPGQAPEERARAAAVGEQDPAPRVAGGADIGLRQEGAAGRPGAVDLNSASAVELEALPGIGPVLAARIVERRRQVGPYSGFSDLMEIQGIGPSICSKLEGLVVFGHGR